MVTLLLKCWRNSVAGYTKHVTSCRPIGLPRRSFGAGRKTVEACSDQPSYVTRLALPPDYENVVDFMCKAQYKHDPSVINIGLEGTEAPTIWRTMLLEQVQSGYSIIAQTPDNCIIGACLNTVSYADPVNPYCEWARCCESGPMSDLMAFYGYVLEMPELWEKYCVSGIFELTSIAVDPCHQKRGVARKLFQESWILARDCGFRLLRIDCHSIYCARLASNYGMTMAWSIPFNQYVRNGEVVFKCVKEPHKLCQVYVDDLQHCKTYLPPYGSGGKKKRTSR